MLREYQTNYEYQSFLRIWEARLDSSQRLQIKGILKPAYEKLKLLNLDPMMNILSVRYSEYGRPAVNQPQIFRSFILLFLLSNIGIVPLSLFILPSSVALFLKMILLFAVMALQFTHMPIPMEKR